MKYGTGVFWPISHSGAAGVLFSLLDCEGFIFAALTCKNVVRFRASLREGVKLGLKAAEGIVMKKRKTIAKKSEETLKIQQGLGPAIDWFWTRTSLSLGLSPSVLVPGEKHRLLGEVLPQLRCGGIWV